MAERARIDRAPWGRVLRWTLLGGGVAVLLVVGDRVTGVGEPAWLIAGLPVAIGALIGMVRATVIELVPRPPPAPEQPSGDGSYRAEVRRLERRLEAAGRDASKYDRNVHPELAQLAQDRLRWRHGVNPRRNPLRAREILGEQLWQLITDPRPGTFAPTPDQLQALVAAIEAI